MLLCAAAGVMNEVCWWLRNVEHGPVSVTAAVTLGVCQQEEDGHLWTADTRTVDTQVTGAECVLDKLSSAISLLSSHNHP